MRQTRPISRIKAARKEFEKFPLEAQSVCLTALTIAAEGGKVDIVKPLHGLGAAVFEICVGVSRKRFSYGVWGAAWGRYLGHPCFSEEIDAGNQDAEA